MKKNLIFDVGGVLIGYRWIEMITDDFKETGDDAAKLGELIFEDPMWAEFDRGTREVEEVVEHYSSRWPDKSTVIRRIFYEGHLMSVERKRVWDRLKALKECGYRIFILSNYSRFLYEMHTKGMPFRDMLDGGIISYEVNMIKPERGIYESLLCKYNLDPEECIFYDDRDDNVQGARAVGIEAVRVTSEEMLLEEIDKFLRQMVKGQLY